MDEHQRLLSKSGYRDYFREDVKIPIIYSPKYNITFFGIEKLHPFDSTKYAKVHDRLIALGTIPRNGFAEPTKPSDEILKIVHTERYLNSLKWALVLTRILEIPILSVFPQFVIQRKVLEPMLYQTGGTIIAGQLALIHGWAINLGGVSIYYNSFNYSNAYKSDFIRDFIMHPATTAEDFACTQI
jgi:hypothetical protein